MEKTTKIKKLTIEKLNKICKSYDYINCRKCPLYNKICCYEFNIFELRKKDLEKEIEICTKQSKE